MELRGILAVSMRAAVYLRYICGKSTALFFYGAAAIPRTFHELLFLQEAANIPEIFMRLHKRRAVDLPQIYRKYSTQMERTVPKIKTRQMRNVPSGFYTAHLQRSRIFAVCSPLKVLEQYKKRVG